MRARTGLALAALAVALTASPAAAGGATADVECGYDTVNQETVTGTDRWTGIGYGHATLSSPDHQPVTARVTCFLTVNGEPRASYGAEGTGVVAFAAPVEFDALPEDDVSTCWEVDYLSDDTPTQTGCAQPCYWFPEGWCHVEFLPELLDSVFEPVNDLLAMSDATTCPILATLPDAGPVTTDDEGDVHVAGDPVWDCPPFE